MSLSTLDPHVPIVVMGVSGSGKTTVGRLVAVRAAVPFVDADDLHPARNVALMSAGKPLTDVDRWPWLDQVGQWLAHQSSGGVAACSALRRSYRDRLRRHCPRVQFLHLDGEHSIIGGRQAQRRGHFMPTTLMSSQWAALEELGDDEMGMVVRVDDDPHAIASRAFTEGNI